MIQRDLCECVYGGFCQFLSLFFHANIYNLGVIEFRETNADIFECNFWGNGKKS